VRENYTGTILIDTARHSEAWAPVQQQAQVEVMNTMLSLWHGIADAVKRRETESADR